MRWFALCAGVVLVVSTASAQTPPAPGSSAALVARGLDARRASNDALALGLFEQAHAIDHAAGSLVQIALAEQALGRWRAADVHLREALAADADPWIRAHHDAITTSLDAIDRHLGALDIVADAPHAELFVNGQPVAALPLREPIRVAAGSTVVGVHAPGFHDAERTVDVAAGGLTRETFALVPLRAEAGQTDTSTRTATPSPGHADGRISAGPFVVGAAGALSFGLAGLFYGLRQGALGGCRVDPDAIHCPSATTASSAQGAAGFNTATNAALAAGGVLIAAGAVWLLIDRLTHHVERRAGLRVAPLAHGGWVGIAGSL